jgi:hypothetical protein
MKRNNCKAKSIDDYINDFGFDDKLIISLNFINIIINYKYKKNIENQFFIFKDIHKKSLY